MLFIFGFALSFSVIGMLIDSAADGFHAVKELRQSKEARLREQFPLLYREARS